jgi:hypothetical protein
MKFFSILFFLFFMTQNQALASGDVVDMNLVIRQLIPATIFFNTLVETG